MVQLILPPRYKQITTLNTNTMNDIFKAFDDETRQWVIIKVMKADPFRQDEYQKRWAMFQHESEVTLRLGQEHPHILGAIDHNTARLLYPTRRKPVDTLYTTFPFIEDGSLSELIRDSPPWEEWTLEQIGDTIRQVASALQFIHARYMPSYLLSLARSATATRPLVHRDVKPENFLVRLIDTPQRKVHTYLGDFGIARTERFPGDQTDEPFGTFDYMAPEQFEGQVVPQSDQYALAVVACYLLTGRSPLELPLDASSRSSLSLAWYDIHKHATPTPPTQLRSDLPVEVDEIILKALSKQVDDRYPTVWLFARMLFDALTGTTRQPSARVPKKPIVFPQSPRPANEPAQTFMKLGLVDDDIANQPTLSVQQEEKPPSGFDWQSLPIMTTLPRAEYSLPASPEMLCWSQDGNYLACLFADHAPVILERHGHKKEVLSIGIGNVACWSPTGHGLAINVRTLTENEEYSQVVLVDNALVNSKPYVLARFPVPVIYGIDWSIRGKLAIWVSEEYHVHIYAPRLPFVNAAHTLEYTLNIPELVCGESGTLRWSPDGAFLAAGGRNGTIQCWSANTYVQVWSPHTVPQQIFCLAWSPDSILLAAAFANRSVTVWNMREQRVVLEWKNLPMVPRVLSISQQRWLAVASNRTDLYLGNIDANHTHPALKYQGYRLVAWSPKRPEFATLHPRNDSRLILYHM